MADYYFRCLLTDEIQFPLLCRNVVNVEIILKKRKNRINGELP